MKKDSLWRLQHLRGIDHGAFSIFKSGLVAHHHHSTFHRSQVREAAARDCRGSTFISFSFRQETHPHTAAWRWKVFEFNTLLTYRVDWASAWQDKAHPSGSQEHSESYKTALSQSVYHIAHLTVTLSLCRMWIFSISECLPLWQSQLPPCSMFCSIHGLLWCLTWLSTT